MAHEDAGHYAKKHPADTVLHPHLAEQVKTQVLDGKISCAEAHNIAQESGVAPIEVGKTIDLLEIRISQCQLGLFGHSPQKRIVAPAATVASELQHAIEEATDSGGLSCSAAWKLAEQFHLSKLDIASACEALKVKISSCQLGTFGKKS